MNFKKGTPLKPGQLVVPVLWRVQRDLPRVYPEASDQAMVERFGAGKAMRLNTYAHVGDKKSAHLIAVRSGTTLHIDPAYTRYTHQLILRNDGYYLHGIDETLPGIPYGPGTMFCCDTHSPHKLSRDPRLTAGMFYVALAVDSDRAMTPDEAWAALGPVL